MEYKKIDDVIIACRDGSDILYVPGYEDAVYDANVPWVSAAERIVRLPNLELVFSSDARVLGALKTQKRVEIAFARYERETAGVTVNGVLIDTGRDSQALITGAALAAMLDENYSLNWKTTAGFIHLTAHEIIAVAQSVRAHVQACFDREAELCALVDAAETAEDLDEIVISWPV